MKKRRVIDTNVPIVANGRDPTHSAVCRQYCIDALEDLKEKSIIIVDHGREIFGEYQRHLTPRGQPGLGDLFFRHLIQNQTNPRVVHWIDLPRDAARNEFSDFPDDKMLATFDRADRKFVAAARRGDAPVLNAVDTDWLEHRVALAKHGVRVEFVCGLDRNRWFESSG